MNANTPDAVVPPAEIARHWHGGGWAETEPSAILWQEGVRRYWYVVWRYVSVHYTARQFTRKLMAEYGSLHTTLELLIGT